MQGEQVVPPAWNRKFRELEPAHFLNLRSAVETIVQSDFFPYRGFPPLLGSDFSLLRGEGGRFTWVQSCSCSISQLRSFGEYNPFSNIVLLLASVR